MSVLKLEVNFGFQTRPDEEQQVFDNFASNWKENPGVRSSIKITFDRFALPSASFVKRIAIWIEENEKSITKVKLCGLRMNENFLSLFVALRAPALTQLSLSFQQYHIWSISERLMGALEAACLGNFLNSLTIRGAKFPMTHRILLKADDDYPGRLLRKLRLDDSTIDSVDLFACLDENRTIEELRVRKCDLVSRHMKVFSRSVCPNLKVLDLSDNPLGEVESSMLATLINNLPSLESLNLTNTHIAEFQNESDHDAFKTALEVHTKLEKIVLTRTGHNLKLCAIQSLFVNRSIKHFIDVSSWANRETCFLQVLRSGNSALETVEYTPNSKRLADTDDIKKETREWLAYNRAMKVYAKEMRALIFCWTVTLPEQVLPVDILKDFPKPSPPVQVAPVQLGDSFDFANHYGFSRQSPKHFRED
jgi:hypothetical protein